MSRNSVGERCENDVDDYVRALTEELETFR